MNILHIFGTSCMLRQQTFLLPVTLLWYQFNGLTAADFVFFQGIFILLGLFSEVPSGYLADIFSKKHILLCSFSLFLIRCLLWLNFTGVYVIIAGEILVVLSRSLFQGIYDSYIYEYLEKNKETDKMVKYYGIVNCYVNVGTGSASLLSSLIYPTYALQVLLTLELITTCTSLILMSVVPNIPNKRHRKSLKNHFTDMCATVQKTLTDQRINHFIVISAIFASSTYIYIWNFQPIMKATDVAVRLFGCVYFCNFFFRALAGYLSDYIQRIVTYKRLAFIVIAHIFIAFLGLALAEYFKISYLTLGVIFLICIGIGAQLSFNILTVATIQKIASAEVRATTSSSYNLVAQGIAGIMLSSFKFLVKYLSFTEIYLLYLGIYIIIGISIYFWKFADKHTQDI